MKNFIHLNVHSEYSLHDSIIRVSDLVRNAKKNKMMAVAMTDLSNMFAFIKFYKEAMANGIKPIIGVDICCLNDACEDDDYELTILCQNEKGLKNLFKLVSWAYQKGQVEKPHYDKKITISKAWLQTNAEGLIVIMTNNQNPFANLCHNGKIEQANNEIKFWNNLCPQRFYLGISRIGETNEELYIKYNLMLCSQNDIPVVAINKVRFIIEDDYETHEVKVCIADGEYLDDGDRKTKYTEQQFFKNSKQMMELFRDIPEAIDNSVQIAYRCNVTIELGNTYLPDFPTKNNQNLDDFFLISTKNKLDKFLIKNKFTDEQKIPYIERLEIENKVIKEMGFAGYFLIVAEFIQWSKDNGIMVGPGRGSGAGSLAAYVLGITDVDPLKYDLLFERFLNPERVSLPDFDIDFCTQGRDEVISHVAKLYGENKVSQIITYGRMAAKGVVRDVGRVLKLPYFFCDRLAKLIPLDIGITLSSAMQQSEELSLRYKNEEDVRRVWDMALKLEGLARNASTHAGGVVIAPSALTDFTPLYCEDNGAKFITQLDKDDVEAIGLVKFDFLGLGNLTIIDKTIKIINTDKNDDEKIDISTIPTDDKAVFENILIKAKTIGVFQLESPGMKSLMQKLKPSVFEDIVALVALYRPGPLGAGMDVDFVNRKHGLSQIEYPHPSLENTLAPTYGTILYQEQVMQIAQILSGYSLGEADILRRAMGKKKKEEMASQRQIFITGAVKNNIDKNLASKIFDDMEKFAEYGFNKSHSVAYAMIAWQTAYLKFHYPAIFMAQVLTGDKGKTEKLAPIIKECNDMGLQIMPPDINQSIDDFYALDDNKIMYGLGAIKGVGSKAIGKLISDREQNGDYKNLDDFLVRNISFVMTKAVVEALIKTGCFDKYDDKRHILSNNMPSIIRAAEQEIKNQQSGQSDLFGGGRDNDNSTNEGQNKNAVRQNLKKWSKQKLLIEEKKFLDLYLSGHPFEQYAPILSNIMDGNIEEILNKNKTENITYSKKEQVIVAGFITKITKKSFKTGPIIFVTIDDKTALIELSVKGQTYDSFEVNYKKDQLLLCKCSLSVDKFRDTLRFSVEQIINIDDYLSKNINNIKITITDNDNLKINQLKQIINKYKGDKLISILYKTEQATLNLSLGGHYTINPKMEFFDKIQTLLGWNCITCH
ncbi:MAG: DNA polymerase III subunit alpha [Gammaproteobacteria bacterium]|nr:MAG: DNA polymerase III subunit alpha [Gammaproteobacteria bacterium]